MKRTSSGRPAHRPARIGGEGGEVAYVNVRVSAQTYDAADARSRRDRISVPAVLRRALGTYLHDPPDPEPEEDDSD